MSKINLDASPYFDDFDASKDFYKVLFKPGFPVQARELTTLQSILQNQVSSLGQHFFKEGAMVIPGGITYNPNYSAVILNPQQGGIDISLYLDQLVGVTIRGATSSIQATVIGYSLPPTDGITNPTIFVSYTNSASDETTTTFLSNEALINELPITYGNTTITAGRIFATTVSTDSTAVGSAAKISAGIYFIRNTFVQVKESEVVLEPYVNIPSYRVGLQVTESIVTAGQDDSLYDNAKGFNNFSAPGADRLKIEAILTKKPLNNYNDTDFIELLRVDEGEIKKFETGESDYNILKDYIAQRTYEESGDYIVSGMNISIDESLNDNIGNNGVYSANQLTDEGTQPSDELAIVKVSSGKAYVRGYDINNPGTVNLDAPKPRTTGKVERTNIPFEMGTRYLVNNVFGTPILGLDRDDNIIELYDGRLDSSSNPTGTKIGEARTYAYNLEDAPYSDATTQWNLYLFDVEMFSELTLNVPATSIPLQAKIRGLSSYATAYVEVKSGSTLTVTQVSGEFIKGEAISINNNISQPYTIEAINNRKTNEVKSFHQDSNLIENTIQTYFSADALLYASVPTGFDASDTFTITGTTLTCPGRRFDSFKVSDLIGYQEPGGTLLTINRITAIDADFQNVTVANVRSVPNVNDGGVAAGFSGLVRKLNSKVLNQDKSFLYAIMEEDNISKTDLSQSRITYTKQITNQSSDADGILVVNTTELGTDGSVFAGFDQERYSIHYADGSIQPLSSSQVEINNQAITFYDIAPNQTANVTVNVTGLKDGIRSKTKILDRIEELVVDKVSSGVGTGEYLLTVNDYYGLRIDDEEISLNYPDVKDILAIYESPDAATPTLDTLVFPNGLSLNTKLVAGEKIIGSSTGAVAIVVSTPTPASVRIIYKSQQRFSIGEQIVFQESNVKNNLVNVLLGNYKDITSNYDLDQGQREQFYDYSRIVRRKNVATPSKKILVIFNRFEVPPNDKGDFYTANSYDETVFTTVPMLKDGTIRATDTLDFRPRVLPWTRTDASPFYYTSRQFGSVGSTPTIITAPNESTLIGFDFYLGRKDKVVLNPTGELAIILGTAAKEPQIPSTIENVMTLAVIHYPPYLYDINDAQIVDVDNRRFTMRDIARIEKRVTSLEEVTSLSLLEQETASLQILDSRGLDRFKSGFFADDFRTAKYIDFENKDTQIDVDIQNSRILPYTNFETINLRLKLQEGIDDTTLDLSSDLPLVDPNTTKTGDLVTLDYNEVQWINQPLASRVEPVNPFSVILYNGNIKLSPPTDDFIITREIDGKRVDTTGATEGDIILQSGDISQYMRERNVSFKADSLRPLTRFYPFFDGSGGVDVIPKLLEIQMTTGTFLIGETLNGFIDGKQVFSARSATPNHKRGNYTSPDRVYTNNPYRRDQIIPSSYSASSNILNIDTESLQDISDDRYYGFLQRGARIVGSVSGAVANVSDIRLVTDKFGEVAGSIFFRDPYETPIPLFRLRTGIRTFRLSSSPTNDTPSLQNQSVSFTETTFQSSGNVVQRAVEVVVPRNVPPEPPALIIDRNITNIFTEVLEKPSIPVVERTVNVENFTGAGSGGDNIVTNNITVVNRTLTEQEVSKTNSVSVATQNPLSQTFRTDETGAFLTSVDIYMSAKSETENLVVQIRPTVLGVPANVPIQDYAQVVLSPNEINISADATVATNVVFPSPIPLEANTTYAIVLVSPLSQEYRAWIARMGETNINEIDSDLSDNILIAQQYINGSLFKSDNGSEWTASQFEDLKFSIYKARFTQEPGTVYLNNPPIIDTFKLKKNPVETLPRKMSLGIDLVTADTFVAGEKIASLETNGSQAVQVVSNIEAVGGPPSAASPSQGGESYVDKTHTNVEFFPIDARGSQIIGDVTVSGGQVTAVSITTPGSGYRVGDTLGIVTSTVENSGTGAVVTIDSITGANTLYLTNCKGELIRTSDFIRKYDAETNTLGNIPYGVSRESLVDDPLYEGNIFIVDMPNHAMQADTNIVTISGLTPDTNPTIITEPIDLTSNQLTVADPSVFSTFEGISTTSGYAFLGGEIIEYQDNGDGTLGISSRGIDNTLINYHDQGDRIYKYELSGVSLRRINAEHTLPPTSQVGEVRDFSKLAIQFDRIGRRNDRLGTPWIPQINFSDNEQVGGAFANASKNIQFNAILPSFGLVTPGSSTNVEATVRTVSGTSAGGDEISFLDQGYQPISINTWNSLESTRLVASEVNERDNLQTLPQNKSFTLALKMQTSDPNISPILDMTQNSVTFGRSSINNPVTDYAKDARTNKIIGDPHSSVYISRIVNIQSPATGLRVMLSAYRDSSSDFRVLYRLFTPNSPNSTPPTWELFPGYTNMVDRDGDGIGDTVIDVANNNGLPNGRVRASKVGEVLEYFYELNELPEYSGFQIKIVFSGTDEAKVPYITDIRAIALA